MIALCPAKPEADREFLCFMIYIYRGYLNQVHNSYDFVVINCTFYNDDILTIVFNGQISLNNNACLESAQIEALFPT